MLENDKFNAAIDAALGVFFLTPLPGRALDLPSIKIAWTDTDTLTMTYKNAGKVEVWKRLRSVSKVN